MASRDSNRQGTSTRDRDQISGDKQKDSRQQQSRDEKQSRDRDQQKNKDSKDSKDVNNFNASAFMVDMPDMPPMLKETPNRKDAGSRGSNTSDRSNRSDRDRDGSQRGSSDESKKRDGRSGREQSSGSSSSKKDNVPQSDGPSDDHNDQPQPGPFPDMQQPPKDGQPQPSGAPDSIKKPDGTKPGMPFIDAAVRNPGMGGMNCQGQPGECGQGQWGQKDIFGNTTNPQSQDCTDPQQCATDNCTANNGPCMEPNCSKQNCGDITHQHQQSGTCATNAQGGDDECGQCDGAEDGGFGARKRCTESRSRRDECDCNRPCRDRDDDWCTNPCCEINRRRRECDCRRRGCYDGTAEDESRGLPRDRRDQLTPEQRRAADEQWEEGRRRFEEGRYDPERRDSERRDQERRDQERRDQERKDREQGSGQREYGPVPEEELEYLRGNRT